MNTHINKRIFAPVTEPAVAIHYCSSGLQHRIIHDEVPLEVPAVAHEVLAGSGQALDSEIRVPMEKHFGHDFSQVGVHTDAQAAESADTVHALAYTVGHHVVFGANQYAPRSEHGRALITHELAHVIEQASVAGSVLQRAKKGVPVQPPRYGLATEPFDPEEQDSSFSEEEQRWVAEIFSLPEVSRMFKSYKDIPLAILHRVKQIAGSASGEARGENIAIADTTYSWLHSQRHGGNLHTTNEQKFKTTLLHELTHFMLHQGKKPLQRAMIPEQLVRILVAPEQYGLPHYSFGWFTHPRSGKILHFDVPEVCGFDPSLTICGTHAEETRQLADIRKQAEYEPSPMPKSGQVISPYEDIAESMALYMADVDSQLYFQRKYPRRYSLIQSYFESLGGSNRTVSKSTK